MISKTYLKQKLHLKHLHSIDLQFQVCCCRIVVSCLC